NGPFRVNSDGKTLALNPSSWNSVANMVYFESPVSVGFSYKEDKQYHNNDKSTAVDNHLALEAFFKKYPNLKKNPFYITGESYAGIYIPMLAHEIFSNNSTINLKGVAIGNGVLGPAPLTDMSTIDLSLSHGWVTVESYTKKIENCCECKTGDVRHECDFYHPANSTKCNSVRLEEVYNPNPYNQYDDCGADVAYLRLYNKYFAKRANTVAISEERNLVCPPVGYDKWINIPEVRNALHVRPEDTHHWYDCGGSYSGRDTDQRPIILDLIDKYHIEKLVIFNGNFDTVCDFIDNQRFVDSLKFKKIGQYSGWRTTDGTLAGFAQKYEKNLSFVLVRGAGHMVPHDKPESALQLLKNQYHEIKDLPDLSDPINFKQYSGYLDIGDGKHYFYWLAESQTAPESAPVVLWLNGGPGCSSLFGNLGENGPFR
ncbi:unnamed protein product, partial [Medioppia subpectinata]